LVEYICSLFKLIFDFLKAGKVSSELHLEIIQASRIFFETFSPILPIGIGWSQLKEIFSFWSDLDFDAIRLRAVAFQSLKIAFQNDS
jgi:hypothetical protein